MRLFPLFVALMFFFPIESFAWDNENNRIHDYSKPESQWEETRDQYDPINKDRFHNQYDPRHEQKRRRYDEQGNTLYDRETGREYTPGEMLPDGETYNPHKDYRDPYNRFDD